MFRHNTTKKYEADNPGAQGKDNPEGESADDYLSKLAKSILSKEKMGPTIPPRGTVEAPPPRRESSSSAPRPVSSIPTPRQAPEPKSQPAPEPSQEAPLAPEPPSGMARQPHNYKDWVREVDFYDAKGDLIPGTILLFEDGAVGVYKEAHPQRDYDVIYMLKESGKIIPQGMPLYNYDVSPIGRLSQGCLEQLLRSGTWERDMMVFHLLKYPDRRHIPEIRKIDSGEHQISTGSSENVSQWQVKKLPASEAALKDENAREQPAFTRGRRLTINFGNQRWDAVYWGKDELGHVVAHDTHEKWNLMHLDLARFKDSITLHDFAGDDVIQKIQTDCSAA